MKYRKTLRYSSPNALLLYYWNPCLINSFFSYKLQLIKNLLTFANWNLFVPLTLIAINITIACKCLFNQSIDHFESVIT